MRKHWVRGRHDDVRDVLLGADKAQEVQELGLLLQLQAIHMVHNKRGEPAMWEVQSFEKLGTYLHVCAVAL